MIVSIRWCTSTYETHRLGTSNEVSVGLSGQTFTIGLPSTLQ